MKKNNFMKRGILTLGFITCSAMLYVSCAEEEVLPSNKSQLLENVSILDDGKGGHNDNADGERGKDNDDVIDIDINL